MTHDEIHVLQEWRAETAMLFEQEHCDVDADRVDALTVAINTLLAAPRREPAQGQPVITGEMNKAVIQLWCAIAHFSGSSVNTVVAKVGAEINALISATIASVAAPRREPEEEERLLRAPTTEPETVADQRVGDRAGSGSCHGGMPHYCPNCDRSFMEAK